VRCLFGNHELCIENVRYIPSLSESIYSLFLHIWQPEHDLDSFFEGGLFLKFPTFTTKALIGRDDIYLDVVPGSHTLIAAHLPNSFTSTSVPVCQKLSDFQTDLQSESSYLDLLLEKLREYYTTIKTKWQLNFDVPAGFRKTTQNQQNILHLKQFTPEHQYDSSSDTIDTASSP